MTGEVDALFAEWDVPHSPGCALGIIHNGELIYARGYGMADLEHDVPITPQSVFDLASTSKQFTAMCIALLLEAGTLSLDDDIRKYLPELPKLDAPVAVHHLIHHTSGWRDYLDLMELKGMGDDDFFTKEDVLELLARQARLNFSAGEDFLYSNTGYYLLGVIVERVSGLSLRKFAQENIFKPLGMANTHFNDDHTEITKGRAIGYAPREQGGYRISVSPLGLVGDGNLVSSVEDLFGWDQNFYHNELGQGNIALIDLLHTTGVKNDGEAFNYAFGLEVKAHRGFRLVCHSGSFVGYRSDMLRFPEQRLSVICLANLSSFNPSKLALRVADLYLTELFSVESGSEDAQVFPAVNLAESELVSLAGLYWNPALDLFIEFTVEDGILMGEAFGKRIEFIPLDSGRFHSRDASDEVELRFERQQANANWVLDLIEGGEAPIRLTRVDPVLLLPEQLTEYSGSYYSPELDISYRIELSDDHLFIRYRNAPNAALKPALPDVFWVAGLVVYFTRSGRNGNHGPITGFTVNTGRAKGILFQGMD